MSNKILIANKICKSFHDPITVQVLNNISFSVEKGEFISVIGRSGCGKSTLLYILSTMDTDYVGDLFIDGILMRDKKEKELASVRNEKIGFVSYHTVFIRPSGQNRGCHSNHSGFSFFEKKIP